MKEPLSILSNGFATIDNNKLQASAEIIMLLSSPVYQVDATGDVRQQREVEQVRFCASPKQLRKLAEALERTADEVEDMLTKATTPSA